MTISQNPVRLGARLLVALGATILLWASAFPGIRAGLEGYGPGELALLRYLVGSATLAAYAVLTGMRPPPLRHWGAFLVIGAAGFTIYNLALNFGERTVTAGPAAFLVATSPLFTALLAARVLREPLGRRLLLGLAVGLAGVGVIALAEEGGLRVDLGAVFILGAALSQAAYFVLQRRWLATYRPLELTAYAIWAGTLLMLPFLPPLVAQVEAAPVDATLAVLYLGVFPGAVAYVAWAYVLSRMPASVAAPYLYVAPVAATLIAWAWLGETPRVLALVGGALALGGVALSQHRRGGGARSTQARFGSATVETRRDRGWVGRSAGRPWMKGGDMRLMWVGGPTVRLEIGSFRVLTDPMLGAGLEAFVMRKHPSTGEENVPIARLSPLPHLGLEDLDVVIASHLHSDHFDARAVERLDKGLEVVAPGPNVPTLREWGFEWVEAVDWKQERTWQKNGERLRVAALPAHHAHDEEADHELGVVNGYLIEHQGPGSSYRIYWSGDTVWFEELRDVAAKVGDVDLLLPHLGGVGKDGGGPWGMISLDAVEGERVVEVFDPQTVIPIHHSTFSFYVEPISEFAERLSARKLAGGLVILREGETWSP